MVYIGGWELNRLGARANQSQTVLEKFEELFPFWQPRRDRFGGGRPALALAEAGRFSSLPSARQEEARNVRRSSAGGAPQKKEDPKARDALRSF